MNRSLSHELNHNPNPNPMKDKMKKDCVAEAEGDDLAGGAAAPEDDKRKRLASGGGPSSAKKGGADASMKSCQAEKCSADLTEAKAYHRRHKVCEHHAKAQAAVVAGIRQRFCQQCSRFCHRFAFSNFNPQNLLLPFSNILCFDVDLIYNLFFSFFIVLFVLFFSFAFL